MRRDEDFSRLLLQELEADSDWIVLHSIEQDSTDEERTKYYHLELLVDAGFLEENGKHGGAFRITNAGHDFLAVTREDKSWRAVKVAANSVGGVTLRMMGELATSFAKQALKEKGLWPD